VIRRILTLDEEEKLRGLVAHELENGLCYMKENGDVGWRLAQRIQVAHGLSALLMLDAGLRIGEVASLLFTDFQPGVLGNASITVRAINAKTAKARTIPLPTKLGAYIQTARGMWAAIALCNLDRPIVGTDMVPTSPSVRTVRRWITLLTWRSTSAEFNPHSLRHTAATRWLKVTDIRTVQELLGHRSLVSTQIYTHPSSDDLAAAVNARAVPCQLPPHSRSAVEELSAAARANRAVIRPINVFSDNLPSSSAVGKAPRLPKPPVSKAARLAALAAYKATRPETE